MTLLWMPLNTRIPLFWTVFRWNNARYNSIILVLHSGSPMRWFVYVLYAIRVCRVTIYTYMMVSDGCITFSPLDPARWTTPNDKQIFCAPQPPNRQQWKIIVRLDFEWWGGLCVDTHAAEQWHVSLQKI